MVTTERRDDVPEHTTVTTGVVVIAVVVKTSDIMKTLKERNNSIKHSRHPKASSQVNKQPIMMGSNWYDCYELRGK